MTHLGWVQQQNKQLNFSCLLNVKEAVNTPCRGLDSWLGHVRLGENYPPKERNKTWRETNLT